MALAASSSISDDQPPARQEHAPVDADPVEPQVPGGEEGPPPPESNLPPIVDPEGEIEELEDRTAPIERRLWAFMPVRNATGEVIEEKLVDHVYMQKGLSFFGKIELYGLLGQAVRVVLEGDNPLGVSSLVGMAQDPRQVINDIVGELPGAATIPGKEPSSEAEMEAGKILAAFAQVVSLAPELVPQAYCIALAIPKTHRVWATEWAFSNMEDGMGTDILHTFIAQNWSAMESFFKLEVPKIVRRITLERSSDGRR